MRVVVLAGGISPERDVSLVSGKRIYQALKQKGHRVMLLDVYLGYPREDWEYVFALDHPWDEEITDIGASSPDLDAIRKLRRDPEEGFFGPHVLDICRMADAVFLALHGESGENGRLQACFDLLGIRYTGADYLSSAIAMHKHLAKDLFRASGVPTPEGFTIRKGGEATRPERFPCVVKTSAGGSSVGVSIVREPEDYEKACEEAFRYGDVAIVEEYVEGREFAVSVIDGQALPVIEIQSAGEFYDYEHKYQQGGAVETCPAKLEASLTRKLQEIAEQAFRAIGLKNYARFDFRMDKEGHFYCLEANTLPGMTPTSLLPQEAAAIGISFEELCERLLQL